MTGVQTCALPICDVAAVVLPSLTEAVGPFDSLGPAIAVVEMVVAIVNERVEGGSVRRIREIEARTINP